MAEEHYKTGENAPQNGKYQVDGFVNEDSNSENDDAQIDMEKGERLPPSPDSHKAVYWKKIS